MAYPQQQYDYQQPRPHQSNMFNSSGYTHSPSESVVAFDYTHHQGPTAQPYESGFPGIIDHQYQQQPYQRPAQYQHPYAANAYQSPYAPRRGSYAGQGSSTGPLSPTNSLYTPPGTSWNSPTPASYSGHAGSPSTSKWSSPGHTIHFGYGSRSSTPFNSGQTQMNAAAPAFTPNFSNHETSPFAGNRDRQFSPAPPVQTEASSPSERKAPVPRLHRTAPSISLSTLNRPVPPSVRSPLMSRGVSPVGSNFSTGADGSPLLNSFGLPINKPRTYKVLLPLESEELHPEDTRKRSLWKRKPLDEDIDVNENKIDETMLAEFRSKSPHPDEKSGPQDLPANLEIYLPNDWVTLRQALFEDRMAKIGITRDYISNMHSLLDQKAPQADDTASSKRSVRPHLRSESVFAAPFVPRWQPPTLKAEETQPAPVQLPSVRRHGASMSMAVPSHSGGFMRQQPPYGPRGSVQPSRMASDRLPLPAFGLAPAMEEEEENEEEKDEGQEEKLKDQGIAATQEGLLLQLSKSAKDLSLKELFAGFGISSELDPGSVPNTPRHTAITDSEALPLADGPLVSVTHERVAIEGATGCMSLPTSASLDGSMEEHANMLNVVHEPRKSVSAPNLHEKSAEASRMTKTQDIEPTSVAHSTEGDESDIESDEATEYSNPSDEERAKQRRDKTLIVASPLPLRNSEKWFEHVEAGGACGNNSDEASLASRRPSWLDKAPVRPLAAGNISLGHAQHASFATAVSSDMQGKPKSLNADAPPFVLGFRLSPRDLGSTSSISSFNYEISKPPATISTEEKHGEKIWNVKAPEFKPSSRSLADSRLNAFEMKARELKNVQEATYQPQTSETSKSAEWEDTPTLVRTLGDAKSAVDSWLTDLTHPDQSAPSAHHSPPIKAEADAHDLDTMRPRTNMRTFKFPPSPSPRTSPPEGPCAIARPPQLPPLGTIGRNTFMNSLHGFTFDGEKVSSHLESHRQIPASRSRPPIPDFKAQAIKEESPSPRPSSFEASVFFEKQPPAASAGDQAGTGDESSSYNVKLESDDEDNLAEFAAVPAPSLQEPDQKHGEPSSEESDSNSVPSSIIRAMHSTEPLRESLNQTWGAFEAILDRKLDGFHARILSHRESTATDTWSPEVKETLANTLRDVIRGEFAKTSHSLESSESSGSSRERIPLAAIQHTQYMINDIKLQNILTSAEAFPYDHASLSSSSGPMILRDSEAIDKITAQVAAAISKVPGMTFDYEKLARHLASTLEDQMKTLLTQIDQHIPQQGLLAGHMYDNEEFEGCLHQTIAHQITESMSASLPPLLLSALPTLVPVPLSPRKRATESYEALRDDFKAAVRQLEQHGQGTKTDMAEHMETIHLQKEIIHLTARCERLSVENESQRNALEVSRQQYATDLSDLRETIVVKDKQLDALREELLRRATIMDQEAREREKAHTAETTALQVTLAGVQTELAILKQQAKDTSSVQAGLHKQLADEKLRNDNADLERRAESAIAQERESAAKSLRAAQEQREQEHLRQISTLQEILSAEAKSRIQLEDRVAAAQDETKAVRQQVAELQTQLTKAQASETSLKTEFEAYRKASEVAEQSLELVTKENRAFSRILDETEARLAEMVSLSQQTITEYLLSQYIDEMPQSGSHIAFQTVFATSPLPLRTHRKALARESYNGDEATDCSTDVRDVRSGSMILKGDWWIQESRQSA